MNKVYNTQENFATEIKNFLLNAIPNIRKTQLKIIPYIVLGMILSESVVASDISKTLKDDFSLIQHTSVVKRIRRLFKNRLFDPYFFYDKIIHFVIATYKKKHSDKRVHIVFDHMFSHDNYTVFMMSMRIGSQGIPLWFRCFEGKNSASAFDESLIKDGISYVSNLFPKEFELIFLADRWFNSTNLLKHISSLGHTFSIRLKDHFMIYAYDKESKTEKWMKLSSIRTYKNKSIYLRNILFTMENKFQTNIVFSSRKRGEKHWIIITNGDVSKAVRDYSYRFGGIESIFKNQKTNGFNMEKTVNGNLKYFESMYSLMCFATLFLTILGCDFSKNSKCYKNIKLETHKIQKEKKIRQMSLFNTGLTLFKRAFNSLLYIRIPYHFTLYDS